MSAPLPSVVPEWHEGGHEKKILRASEQGEMERTAWREQAKAT
ncbi:hypothetical protein [Dictyobacter vulcani]|nr:hypothetical protein [Dictyobacter vulcani]